MIWVYGNRKFSRPAYGVSCRLETVVHPRYCAFDNAVQDMSSNHRGKPITVNAIRSFAYFAPYGYKKMNAKCKNIHVFEENAQNLINSSLYGILHKELH
jgi:hypothetical protein